MYAVAGAAAIVCTVSVAAYKMAVRAAYYEEEEEDVQAHAPTHVIVHSHDQIPPTDELQVLSPPQESCAAVPRDQ